MAKKTKLASYKVLDLQSSANKTEILAKFRELAIHWEPERHDDKARALKEFKKITEAAINLLFGTSRDKKLDDLYKTFLNLFRGEENDVDPTGEYNEDFLKSFYEISIKIDEAVAAENAIHLICEEAEEKLKLAKKKAKNKKKKEKKKQLKTHQKQNVILQEEGEERIISNSEEEIDLNCTFVAAIANKQKHHKATDSLLIKKDPRTEIYSYCQRATEMVQNGHIPKAIEFFSKAIELEPLDYRLYINRSVCHFAEEEFKKALEDVQKCVDLCPSYPEAYFHKGKVLLGLKQFASAEECFKEALNLDNNYENARYQLFKVKLYQITQMGFTKEAAEAALSQNCSVQEAIESLLSRQFSQASAAEKYDNVSDDEN